MNWAPYLESIRHDSRYALSRECFTPLDVQDHRAEKQPESPFLLDLRVRTVLENTSKTKSQSEQKVERWDVLDGLRRHATEHVLLVGRPGSGKSTALQRLLLEEAEQALNDVKARIPVLLELRHYQTSTPDLIERVLRMHGLFADAQRLPEWLQQGRFLLLVDGINELPSDTARRELATFRREYRTTTPMIFATRELAVGGDLEIGKRLEMEPLAEPQMRQFVRAYLGEDGDKLLRQLQGRLQELAGVPLLLWMLCSLFRETRERLPENLGLALRQFATLYDRQLKGDAPVSEESRRWWPCLLQRLAFKMLEGPEPTELYVAVARSQAEDWLTDYLQEEQCDQPRNRAMAWLNDLVNHHLLQRSAGDRIEFRHQFIQEYYAAEYVLRCLPKLDDITLQRDYLNYLKWTEPLILLLGLVEDHQQALRIVKLAEAVDWSLAARLAGAVRPDWQAETIRFIAKIPQIPEWHQIESCGLARSYEAMPTLKEGLHDLAIIIQSFFAQMFKVFEANRIRLYGLTQSYDAIPALKKGLHNEAPWVRLDAARALGRIGGEAAISTLTTALHDESIGVRLDTVEALEQIGGEAAINVLVTALHHEDTLMRRAVAQALGRIGGEAAINILATALRDEDTEMRRDATQALGQIGEETAVSVLATALHDEDVLVRREAIHALGQIGGETATSALTIALHDEDIQVRWEAIHALGQIGGEMATNALTIALHDEDARVRRKATQVLEQVSDTSLLTEFSIDFRQNAPESMIINPLQRRLKVYRYDALWSQSVETTSPPAEQREKTMRTLRIVLASPSDVQPERDVLPGVIEEVNRGLGAVLGVDLKLYRWETDAYPGFHLEGPQDLIDNILRIDDCDVLIGIFWKRFGKPTKSAGSGTEHEFLTAYEAWKKNKRPQIMMYFKDAPYSPKTREEVEQWGKVLDLKTNFPEEGLWWPFPETSAFKDLVRTHLSGWLRDNFKK